MKDKMTGVEVKIAILQEKVNRISENELVHLSADIKKVDEKVDNLAERVENRFDSIDTKLARYSGGIAVIVILADWLLRLLFGK